jgi:hypothetical protein
VDSDAALHELIAKHQQTMAFKIAYVFAFRGEADRAFDWLEKASDNRNSGLGVIAIQPFLKSLRAWCRAIGASDQHSPPNAAGSIK